MVVVESLNNFLIYFFFITERATMDLLSDGSTLLRIETAAFIPVAVICGIGIVIVSLFIAVNVKYRNYK